jgi:integrase/recombinase XerD
MNSISFSQAVDGFLLAANARHLSQHTIKDYLTTFRKFHIFLDDDPPISAISAKRVEAFLAAQEVSNKTVLNYHIGLSALWTWCVKEELVNEHILHKVERPKPEKRQIKPYTQTEVKDMLASLTHSRFYTRSGKRESNHSLRNAERNRAMIYLLLDTGVRASELSNLHIHHVNVRNRTIMVMGKGNKERIIPFSARTGQVLWRYLAQRKGDSAGDFLFVTEEGRRLERTRILRIIQVIGERAGVYGANVHRFRHTFAINYLRNGGDAYSLQLMLGHSTMEMVKNYLDIVQGDLEKNHKIASPVDNWRL